MKNTVSATGQVGNGAHRAGGQAARGRAENITYLPLPHSPGPSCPATGPRPRQFASVRVHPRQLASVSSLPPSPPPSHCFRNEKKSDEKSCCIAAIAAGALQVRDEENLTSLLTPGTRAEQKYWLLISQWCGAVDYLIPSHLLSLLLLLLIIISSQAEAEAGAETASEREIERFCGISGLDAQERRQDK